MFGNVNFNHLRADLIAGITVAIILVPQCMAYAVLTGLPSQYGLYGSFVPLMLYPFIASSRHLSVGPIALISIILFDGLRGYAEAGTTEFIDLVLMTGLVAGVIQVIFSYLKLGVISNFLSRPVISGFVSAAGLIIIASQLSSLLALHVDKPSTFFMILLEDINKISSFNMIAMMIGVLSLVFIMLSKRFFKKLPSQFIVVLISILLVYFFRLGDEGVPILREIQGGFPPVGVGFISLSTLRQVFPTALTISLISFITSFSIASSIAEKSHDKIIPDRELLALGLSKIAGSFLGSMPATGSFSRSAINFESGAKSGLSSVIAACIIGLTMLFLAPLFYHLPYAVLAAIVIGSVYSFVQIEEAKRLFHENRVDFYHMMITLISTLVLGIVNGIIVGVILSLLSIIIKASRPHFAELGRLPGTMSFRNVDRYNQAERIKDTLILRYDQDLYFVNAEHFYNAVIRKVDESMAERLILHMGPICSMDSTGLYYFKKLLLHLQEKNIDVNLTNLRGVIIDLFDEANINDVLPQDACHLNVMEAVNQSRIL